jgi:hypothetical protein
VEVFFFICDGGRPPAAGVRYALLLGPGAQSEGEAGVYRPHSEPMDGLEAVRLQVVEGKGHPRRVRAAGAGAFFQVTPGHGRDASRCLALPVLQVAATGPYRRR